MRLEYTDEQERALRITELEAILENDLYEDELEEYCLNIEYQFLQGGKNADGKPQAFLGIDGITFEVIHKEESKTYSITSYDEKGNPSLCLGGKDLEGLLVILPWLI